MPGEFDFIRWLRGQQRSNDLVLTPAGDDLAVLRWPADDLLVVGVDQVLDGRHFDIGRHSPRQIGTKVMNRNLSDCAAMAALPAAALATVAMPRPGSPRPLPPGADALEFARELYLGMKAAADIHYCAIVGGDTASWEGPLALTVTILARSAGIEPIRRTGAQPGDGIYVTGPLGGSILGRHLSFTPRVSEGRRLGNYKPLNRQAVTAMIDLSDGLSRDLPHLTAPGGLGAVIEADKVPVHEDAVALSLQDNLPPLHHALHDGEDHELLFTCPLRPPIGHRIGTITREPGIVLRKNNADYPLTPQGWEHGLG